MNEERALSYRKDYFICHASADKDSHARPLARVLERAGMTCWLDEAEILPGDSITSAIDRGLVEAQYVIVLITPAFLAPGQWRFYELRTALAQQIISGTTRIVPIVGDLGEEDRIAEAAALLTEADRVDNAVRAAGVVDAHEAAHDPPAARSGWDEAGRREALAARLESALPDAPDGVAARTTADALQGKPAAAAPAAAQAARRAPKARNTPDRGAERTLGR